MLYAFCDEFGAFGFDFEKDNVSSHFIIAAINSRRRVFGLSAARGRKNQATFLSIWRNEIKQCWQ